MKPMFSSYRWLLPRRGHPLLAVAVAMAATLAGPALAQSSGDSRNSFPGRRIGGGSRGECTSRPLVHLVPSRSVYAPGSTAVVGILEGPSAAPRPLMVEFRPFTGSAMSPAGTDAEPSTPASRRLIPGAPAGVTLLSLPGMKGDTVWESSYQCQPSPTAAPAADAGLQFVTTETPPALSLLVQEGMAEDTPVRARLEKLRNSCGSSVDRSELAAAFGLSDVISDDWPERLPVRCPG